MPADFVNPVTSGTAGQSDGSENQLDQGDFKSKSLEPVRINQPQFVKPPLFVAFSGAESGALRNSEGGYLTIGAWGSARNKI